MYEIVKVLDKRRVTLTAKLVVVLARCTNCNEVSELLMQNVVRSNKAGRKRCAECAHSEAHHLTNTRIWRIWRRMVSRATNPSDRDFSRYGAVGRGVCGRWLSFKAFYADMHATYQDSLTLDRVDNTKGYCAENCRWATVEQQQSNKATTRVVLYQGASMHLAQYCRVVGCSRGAITRYLDRGLSGDEAAAEWAMSKYPKNRSPRQYST